MVKRLFISMLMGMMALGAVAQEGKFTVKGTFDFVEDTVSFILHELEGQTRAVTGEMLEVTFDLKDANYITIGRWFNGRQNKEEGDITLPAIPGETLVVSMDENGELRLGGSQFYVDYDEARKTVEPVNQAGDVFMQQLREKVEAGMPEEELMDFYQENVNILLAKLSDAVMDYVKAHPDQDAAAALIDELPEELEYLEPAVALLTERARNSVAANLYKEKLDKALKEAAKHAQAGSVAPDFTLMDINGNPLALS